MEEPITYRSHIIATINTLVECDNMLFTEGINVLMSGEMKDVDAVFEEGEMYSFNISHLETAKDANVQLILQSINSIRNTIFELQQSNDIEDEAIEWG